MTVTQGEPTAQIVVDPVFDWRCGAPGCFYKPLLGRFSPIGGGVHIQVNGRRSAALNWIVDIFHNGLRAHCPTCHAWRELYWNEEKGIISEREWTGFQPFIGCKCQQVERGAEETQQRRERGEHGTAD